MPLATRRLDPAQARKASSLLMDIFELAVFDPLLYIRVRNFDEPA
jgi:hypothetical protein